MDRKARLNEILDIAVQARRLFPHGGFADLEPNSLQILLCLAAEGEQGATQISRRLGLDLTTVSHGFAVLRERELVALTDDADGRRRPHRITPSGRRLVDRYVRSIEETRLPISSQGA